LTEEGVSTMGHRLRFALAGSALVAAALGGGWAASAAPSKPTIVIGATNFPEQAIVANAYADVLEHAGYTVDVKADLGTRAVVEPALAHGQLDIEPDYAGTLLLFLNPKATKAADQLATAVPAIKRILAKSGATVLEAAPAIDSNVFVVTHDTASKYHLRTVSGLRSHAPSFVLGGPPECPTRPTCLLGLEKVYGLHFSGFKSLDEAGAISVAALKQGQVQVVELFSSDGNVVSNGFVALTDDKHLQPADNVIPVIRRAVDTPQLAKVLNRLSAKLTTAELSKLNVEVSQNQSPATVALAWVKAQGLG
jgi:osmoprotectant transport system substrate-binding protein